MLLVHAVPVGCETTKCPKTLVYLHQLGRGLEHIQDKQGQSSVQHSTSTGTALQVKDRLHNWHVLIIAMLQCLFATGYLAPNCVLWAILSTKPSLQGTALIKEVSSTSLLNAQYSKHNLLQSDIYCCRSAGWQPREV